MIKILFVCHGNICRSVMAQHLLCELARQEGVDVIVDSAAVSREEIGNGIYPAAREKLRREGIPIQPHYARQITKEDYANFDRILGMDRSNIRAMLRILGGDPENKVSLLLGTREVADPWYTGDFDQAYRDIFEGCQMLLREENVK